MIDRRNFLAGTGVLVSAGVLPGLAVAKAGAQEFDLTVGSSLQSLSSLVPVSIPPPTSAALVDWK